jgi:hypothetical protein
VVRAPPADEPYLAPVLGDDHAPAVVLLLVDEAVPMKGLGGHGGARRQ